MCCSINPNHRRYLKWTISYFFAAAFYALKDCYHESLFLEPNTPRSFSEGYISLLSRYFLDLFQRVQIWRVVSESGGDALSNVLQCWGEQKDVLQFVHLSWLPNFATVWYWLIRPFDIHWLSKPLRDNYFFFFLQNGSFFFVPIQYQCSLLFMCTHITFPFLNCILV